MPREDAEKNPDVKQIIPYVVVSQDEDILTYSRTHKGGENRLHDKFSIGIGGHINRSDIHNGVLDLWEAASREVSEEITIIKGDESFYRVNSFGVLYDPSNDVGKVHFGIIYRMHLSWCNVMINEEEIANLRWLSKYKLRQLDNLENWSQILLKAM
jgi:predicted NUDIX family phosphoesterase